MIAPSQFDDAQDQGNEGAQGEVDRHQARLKVESALQEYERQKAQDYIDHFADEEEQGFQMVVLVPPQDRRHRHVPGVGEKEEAEERDEGKVFTAGAEAAHVPQYERADGQGDREDGAEGLEDDGIPEKLVASLGLPGDHPRHQRAETVLGHDTEHHDPGERAGKVAVKLFAERPRQIDVENCRQSVGGGFS